MKINNNKLISIVLVFALLIGAFPTIVVSASEYDEIKNNSDDYNCYAYAIGRFEETKFYWPLDYQNPRYHPSDIYKSFSNIYDSYYDVYGLATLVENDLLALGCTNISIYQSAGDDYNVNDDEINTYTQLIESIDFDSQELICMRIVDSTEFHFMKYDVKTNSWYNKHGFGPIIKYTDNGGIPSNNVYWEGNGYIYTSNIVYMIYDRFQINVVNSISTNQNIIIKGGENIFSGKDAFYEIVIPATGCYTIEMETPTVEVAGRDAPANFNYEIYSYNMYNGNYIVTSGSGQSGSTFSETINLTAYDDYNDGTQDWQYQAYKHYIRLDFGRANTTDQVVTVNITHQHTYTDHYGQITDSSHEAYCWCGEYITESHQFVDGVCTLCGEAHEHLYGYSWLSDTTHKEVCLCGEEGDIKPHVVKMGSFTGGTMYATCLLCGGRVSRSPQIILSVNQLPHTENGSYITPDGIIVLADEDMEAYFDGTLEFVYPDGNLETE